MKIADPKQAENDEFVTILRCRLARVRTQLDDIFNAS